MKILIYGLGHIGSALATGFKNDGTIEVFGYSRTDGLDRASKLGIEYFDDFSSRTLNYFDYIIICTRNDDQKAACEFFDQFEMKATIVSVASGVKLKEVEKNFTHNHPRILRIMPNLFSSINKGATLLDKNVANEIDEEIFSKIGSTYLIDEELFSVATIVSGCSPAYLTYFLNAIAQWGVENKLDNDDARGIISDLFIATGEYLRNKEINVDKFIESVCVPGGVTVEGINSFKKNEVNQKIKDGLTASLKRDQQK